MSTTLMIILSGKSEVIIRIQRHDAQTHYLPSKNTSVISTFLLRDKCPIVANTIVPINMTVATFIKHITNASLHHIISCCIDIP